MNVDTLAIPVENGAPVRVKVTDVGDSWHLAWCRDGGLTVEPFGPAFDSLRVACQIAARINARTGQ